MTGKETLNLAWALEISKPTSRDTLLPARPCPLIPLKEFHSLITTHSNTCAHWDHSYSNHQRASLCSPGWQQAHTSAPLQPREDLHHKIINPSREAQGLDEDPEALLCKIADKFRVNLRAESGRVVSQSWISMLVRWRVSSEFKSSLDSIR